MNTSKNVKSESHILRSIGAVLAGLIIITVISLGTDAILHATGVWPPWAQPMADSQFALAIIYRTVYCILGSYITARLAPKNPMGHALILGVIGLVLTTIGTAATWDKGPEFGPKWYPIALVVTALPCAWIGGKIRVSQLSHRPNPA